MVLPQKLAACRPLPLLTGTSQQPMAAVGVAVGVGRGKRRVETGVAVRVGGGVAVGVGRTQPPGRKANPSSSCEEQRQVSQNDARKPKSSKH
jgi:hypothetical protein